jgi:hypothetical protein
MSITRMGDFVYALRIITLLTTPWEKQAAFKFGIIDKDGNNLRKFKDLKTSEERDSFTYLHRMVFNMKRLLQTVPGGKSWLGAATASLLLLKEGLSELNISDKEWRMIEETVFSMLDEETPTNVTGAAVSTDTPKPLGLVRRKKKEDGEDLTDDKK